MRNLIPVLMLLVLSSVSVNAQLASNYYFEAKSGTYTPITGTVATIQGGLDEGVSDLLPIGFTFTFNGIDYTQLQAAGNGFVKLGAVLTNVNNTSSNLFEYYNDGPLLAPLWDDILANAIRYETTGSAPERIFTIQWSQVRWQYNSVNPGIEFQIKLYETSNRIEFIYNNLLAILHVPNAAIGISALPGGDGNYITLTNTSTNPGTSSTEMKFVSASPATGQVYAFYTAPACSGMPAAGTTVSSHTTACAGADVHLSVSGSSIATGLSFQWQSSADGTNWQNINLATDTNYKAPQTVATHYRRATTCGTETAYSTPVLVTTGTLAATYATLPFTENFETTWLSNCGLRELPSIHFKNTPVTGNRSWRRDDDPTSAEWDLPSFGTWITNNTHAARFLVRDGFSTTDHGVGNLDLYVDCSVPGTKELKFRHVESSGYDLLTVLYSTDGGANFTSLGTVQGIDAWRERVYIIPSNSATTIIRFQGKGQGFSGSSDIGIDDISVSVPACIIPSNVNISNIGQNTATISWDAVPGAEGYQYEIINTAVPSNYTIDQVFTTNTTVNVTNLTGMMSYYLHVRAKCGDNSYSSWVSKPFITSMDCSLAQGLTCGTPFSFNIHNGYGFYDLFSSDPGNSCGRPAFGIESLMRFVPPVTGTYSFNVTASDANYDVYYYIKDAAQGCAPSGWTCLGTLAGTGTLNLGTLTAGKEYFILIDLFTIVNGHAETVVINCQAANPDCMSGSITPAGPVSICSGSNQLLQVSSGGTAWQWYKDGVLIAGATNNSYTATEGGVYSVAITNGTCTTVSTNKVTITSIDLATPDINTSGNTTFCEGGSVGFATTTVPGPGITYQWKKDGNDINGANTSTYTATTSGSYTVTVTTSNNCSVTSLPTVVTVNAIPAAPVITPATATTFCQGGSVAMNVPATAGNTYKWFKNGVLISSGFSTGYVANTAGVYTVSTSSNGCESPLSAGITVTVNAVPATPTISTTTTTTFCQGGNVVLTSSSANGNQWKKDGNDIGGATAATYTATTSGVYTVQVTQSGCASTVSAGTTVTVTAIPAVPTITAAGNVLSSSAATGNQWYKDGNSIIGATASTYTATASGQYTVKVTINNCSSTSLAFAFIYTGIVDPSSWNNSVIIYPNPASGSDLFLKNERGRKLSLRLADVSGKTVFIGELHNYSGSIPTKRLASGVYQLFITDTIKNETIIKKILIQ